MASARVCRVNVSADRGRVNGYSNTPRREIVDRRIEDFKSRKIDELRTRAVELVEAESEPGDCHRAESVQRLIQIHEAHDARESRGRDGPRTTERRRTSPHHTPDSSLLLYTFSPGITISSVFIIS